MFRDPWGGGGACVWCVTATAPSSSFSPQSQELRAEAFQAFFTRGIELRLQPPLPLST